jgi:hypothetical protein
MFWRRKPIERGDLDKPALHELLVRRTTATTIKLHDSHYKTVDPADLKDIKKRLWHEVKDEYYVKNSFDCDKFALAARLAAAKSAARRIPGYSYAFGTAVVRWGDGRDHGIIFCLMTSGDIAYLEPQWSLDPAKGIAKELELYA